MTVDADGTEKIDGALTASLTAARGHIVIQAGFQCLASFAGDIAAGDVVLSSDLTGGNLGAANTLTALPIDRRIDLWHDDPARPDDQLHG